MSDEDAGRCRWVRRNAIPGHWMDVRAWVASSGVREKQAVCECGWRGPFAPATNAA
jgi:hypothetical protein